MTIATIGPSFSLPKRSRTRQKIAQDTQDALGKTKKWVQRKPQ